MSGARSLSDTLAGSGLQEWVPVLLRLIVAVALVPAGAMKFLEYGARSALFAELGVPAAGLTVLFVGAVELCAAVALALGAAGRIASLVVIPVMLTAMALVGIVPSNLVVLLASLGIVVLGPGRYALWEPETEIIDRLSRGLPVGT